MDQKHFRSTEMSQGGKDTEKSLHNLADTIADNFIAKLRPLLLDFMDQKQFHSTEMSQGGKDSEKGPQSLTESIGEKITGGSEKTDSLFSSACIYRVPKELWKLNESAYTPRLIAIGPLHRNGPHLQTPLQHVKFSYTNYLFCRLTKGIEDAKLAEEKKFKVLQECLAEMRPLIDDAKKYYAEEVTLNEEMLLVDGCFILELLYRGKSKVEVELLDRSSDEPKEEEKPMKGRDRGKSKQQPLGEEGDSQSSNSRETGDPLRSIWNANIVQQDLLLLENQIPYSVLKKLFELTVAKIPERPCNSLTNYISSYFGDMMSSEDNSKNSAITCRCDRCSPSDLVLNVCGNEMKNSEDDVSHTNANVKYYHILHKLHEDYIPHKQMKKKKQEELIMPPASDLEYAGIKFISGTGEDKFNVKFIEHKGVRWWCCRAHFAIPPLCIYDSTEAFLRNLIAFEQCHPQASQHFTCYAYLMDMLVNSEKDVQVLEKVGILSNHLGDSEDATVLFNKLCKEIVVQHHFIFAETCNKATKYSKHRWPKTTADLKRTYFASPWTFIAFCVGFIAFGVSITQFVISFL